MINTIQHSLSLSASLIVLFVSLAVLFKMTKQTAILIVIAYAAMFAGSGSAAMISAWEIVSGGHSDDGMHLSMLVVIAGLSMLLLASRRRECLCPDCPARRAEDCVDCDQRGEAR